jgi:flagellar protein FlgJ
MTPLGKPSAALRTASAAASFEGRRLASLEKACNEFEALLLQQMLESMRKTVGKDGMLGDDHAGQIVQDMFDDQLARGVAAKGGIGLAALIFDRMKTNL